MAKHMVVCRQCGKQFDANRGAGYDPTSRRYTCPSCLAKARKAAKARQADQRERQTGMRQSTGAMVAKIAIGAMFVIVAFTMDSAAEVLVGLVTGFALIAWGVLPWWKAKKDRATAVAVAEAERQEIHDALMNAPKICKCCGARTKGIVCEYCSSPLD